jgi:uncharacterized protein (TIGR03437 family)
LLGDAVQGVIIKRDAQARVLFSGYRPGSPFSCNYVARLTSDGSAWIDLYNGPEIDYLSGPALTITSAEGFAMSQSGALWIETGTPGPSLLNVANSADGQYSNTLARVELISFFGVGIGPQTAFAGQVQNGVFTSSLAGCHVLFDGVPAPLLNADSGQINAVVPRGVGASPHLSVVTPGGTIDGPDLLVSGNPVPAIFQNSQTGLAAALNQDGSVNSLSNPASSGSIVTLFATGGGANNFADGAVVPAGIYNTSEAVAILAFLPGQESLEVLFAGDAPGLVAGVMQINFRLPDSLPRGDTITLSLEIGGVASSPVQIAVEQ